MGKVYDAIDGALRAFIEAQHVFFVATAPAGDGHVNLSPKGFDSLRIVDRHTVLYLDYVGSGAETIAHLRDGGRIVLMVCAFEGPPKIVRLHGHGEAIEPAHSEFAALRALFPSTMTARSVVRMRVTRISDSCGFGVPLYEFRRDRSQLPAWVERKGEEGLLQYQRKHNSLSIDGLPALEWTRRD